MKILVTGGMGYIGSHTVVQLIEQGFEPIIFDNLANASIKVLDRITNITGTTPTFIQGDICDLEALNRVFAEHTIDAVIHFAGLKAVGESVEKPLEYYLNNVYGTLNLVQAMQTNHVHRIIFSSSATVYGAPATVPITEDFPTSTTNPYGTSKLMVEQCLTDFQAANPDWTVTLLRYFNPAGAHPSGTMGEDPKGIPNNLLPYITQVAVGRREKLSVFGNQYPTKDGTGVRDYIHIQDLASGHIAALKHARANTGTHIFNLGTGQGYSVLDIIKAFEQASGQTIPYAITPERPGDIAECWADASKAKTELGWQCELGIEAMMTDSWNWQRQNPNGYE